MMQIHWFIVAVFRAARRMWPDITVAYLEEYHTQKNRWEVGL